MIKGTKQIKAKSQLGKKKKKTVQFTIISHSKKKKKKSRNFSRFGSRIYNG